MEWMSHEWVDCDPPASEALLKAAELIVGDVLPGDYKECARLCHGGHPTNNTFAFNDPEVGRMEGCVGVLLSLSTDNNEGFFAVHQRLSPFLPPRAIPIADDGGGDFVCLDYSQGAPPSIGYWHHGADTLVYLAPSFTAFLQMLYDKSPEFTP